jgi:hypothetical protein
MHTVHYQMPGGRALCSRKFTHTRPPTIDGTEWDIANIHTCRSCKALFLLFFRKGIDPAPIQDAPNASNEGYI